MCALPKNGSAKKADGAADTPSDQHAEFSVVAFPCDHGFPGFSYSEPALPFSDVLYRHDSANLGGEAGFCLETRPASSDYCFCG